MEVGFLKGQSGSLVFMSTGWEGNFHSYLWRVRTLMRFLIWLGVSGHTPHKENTSIYLYTHTYRHVKEIEVDFDAREDICPATIH